MLQSSYKFKVHHQKRQALRLFMGCHTTISKKSALSHSLSNDEKLVKRKNSEKM
jgi:hypothetical protein